MASIPSQILYQLIMSNTVPLIVSSCNSIYSSYFGTSNKTTVNHIMDLDDEKELDKLQMDRLLKWMSMIFDSPEDTPDSHRDIKQELYNIFCTISSDFKQYQGWKKYNNDLWVMTSYRKKNTKSLAGKILCDIKLFNEGLKMYSIINRNNNKTVPPIIEHIEPIERIEPIENPIKITAKVEPGETPNRAVRKKQINLM
jgi:hypothetical protein